MLKTYISKKDPVEAIKISLENLPEIIQVLEGGRRTYAFTRLKDVKGVPFIELLIGVKKHQTGDYVIVSDSSVFGMSESDFKNSYEEAVAEVPLVKNFAVVRIRNMGHRGASFNLSSDSDLFFKLREGTRATLIFGANGAQYPVIVKASTPISNGASEFNVFKENGAFFLETSEFAVIIV
jgi:hypothetical protein